MSALGEKLAWNVSNCEVRRPLPAFVLSILLRRSKPPGVTRIKHSVLGGGVSRIREPELQRAIMDLAEQGYIHVVSHQPGEYSASTSSTCNVSRMSVTP